MNNKRNLAILSFLLVMAFAVLVIGGYLIHRDKPPVPGTVRDDSGTVLFTRADVMAGQALYFSRGGQHIGTIWGHGSYLAPDWSADYIHRSALFLAARFHGAANEGTFSQADLEALPADERGRLQALVAQELKNNRYDAQRDELVLSAGEAGALRSLTAYYTALFRDGNERMGMQPGIVRDADEGRLLSSFFAWLAWAAVANRPGSEASYTSNWPYDPLAGNQPGPSLLLWSIASVVLLILALAVILFWYLRVFRDDDYQLPAAETFAEPTPTPSQRATLFFFIAAMALFLVQIVTGSLTGHFTVEGTRFLGLPLGKIMPYAAVRTWHLQLSIFWIATCFLAAGLFLGPLVGREPKGQSLWTKVLLGALVVVVVGTLAGTWLSVQGHFNANGFLLGHQGYEYIELGRLWQLLLIAGMLIWLALVWRAIRPALQAEKDYAGLTHLLLYSSVAIPLFYMAGLMYGRGSHVSDAEYWRWWVVHLWVEGFFEVFATVVLAFILTRIGVVSRRLAEKTVYFSVFLYLGSGVIGTFHHLYWSGSPAPIIALGAVFSALEVVPLTLLVFESAHNLRLLEKSGPAYAYRWPILFFTAVAFWNVLGAGVFGFLINPPIVLYFAQGINTTPLHGHTALFGVYGLLAIALMLFAMRHTVRRDAWSDRLAKWSFWGLNGGLALMTVVYLLPSGFYQFYHAVRKGMWYARSPEITSGPVMRDLALARIVPDLIFAAGALLLFVFVVRATWLTLRRQADGHGE